MAIFGSAQDLYEHFIPFMEQLVEDPDLAPKLVAANLSFRMNFSDPDAMLLLDATEGPAVELLSDAAGSYRPEIDLFMSADDGHRFWSGDLNLLTALVRREVRAVGPIAGLLELLPALESAHEKYREYTAASRLATLRAPGVDVPSARRQADFIADASHNS